MMNKNKKYRWLSTVFYLFKKVLSILSFKNRSKFVVLSSKNRAITEYMLSVKSCFLKLSP